MEPVPVEDAIKCYDDLVMTSAEYGADIMDVVTHPSGPSYLLPLLDQAGMSIADMLTLLASVKAENPAMSEFEACMMTVNRIRARL